MFCKWFKNNKQPPIVPDPEPRDSWDEIHYKNKVAEGVRGLQQGGNIVMFNDDRAYEMALEIKHRFILEYQRQLSERIKITNSGEKIFISIRDSNEFNEVI
jgi:hypothetical protein